MGRKSKTKKAEYGFTVVMKEVDGVMFPVKVYDPVATPDMRGAAPRALNSQDLITAGLTHLVEEE